jgi:hypothetical protein
MKKTLIFFLAASFTYFSCKQNESTTIAKEDKTNDTTHFFQITQFIRSQIDEVNRTPYFIYKVVITNGKKDSAAINNAIFNQVSSQFLKPDINDAAIKKYYKESIFHDQTTKSFTISYTASDRELELQSVDVLLQEDGQTVKRVFMRKFFSYPDSTAIEQLSWKPNESFQVNRLVQKPDNKETTYETTVVWNEKS